MDSVPLAFLSPTGTHDPWLVIPTTRVVVSVCIFYAIFLLGGRISSWLSDSYNTLSAVDKIRWNLRVVALTHALASTAAGFRIYYYDTQLWDDPIGGWSELCYFMSPWTWGYMLFDLAFLVWNYAIAMENPVIILHHLYILIGGALYWIYAPVAWGYCCNLMVTELSTIFLHINAFYLMSGAPKGKLFVANGLSLLVAFTYRVVISLHLTYWLYVKNEEISSVAPALYNFLFGGSIVLGAMNINWYIVLLMHVVRHFFPSVKTTENKRQ